VSKYIPAFEQTTLADGNKPVHAITIRDCLRHTNGLESDQRNTGTLSETVEALAKSKLAFEPGSKWKYGPGLSVAGRVVEVVSGKPFDQFLAERIFMPLEMKETTFRPTAQQQQRLAKLYQTTDDKTAIEPGTHWLFELSPDTTPNPSGGLFSTAADIAQFYQMVLNSGELNGKRVLSADAVAQMTSVQTGDVESGLDPETGWGLGFSIVREPKGPTQMISAGTFGHGGAFNTQSWADPTKEMIFIYMVAHQKYPAEAPNIRAAFQTTAVEAVRD
jgi:CubicO group peptidase (beta-lactamase class C family)